MATRIEDDGPTRAAVLRLVVKRIRLLDRRLFAAGWGCYRDPCPETLSGNAPDAGACRDVVVQAAALACQRWR